jgi:O-antigen/teichoic acid export membrane protein
MTQLIELAAQLLVAIMVARLLGPADFGRFAVATGLAGLAAMVLQPGTTDLVMQLCLEGRENRAVIGAGLVRLAQGSWRALAVLAIGAVVSGVAMADMAVVVLVGVALLFNGAGAILGAVLLARGQTVRDLGAVLLGKGALVGGALIGGLSGELSGVMLAVSAAAALQCGLRANVLRGVGAWPPRHDAVMVADLARRGRRLSIGVMAGAVAARADTLVLQRLSTTTEVGLYAAGFRIIAGCLALAQATMLAAHPMLARIIAGRHRRNASRLVCAVMAISVAIALLPLTGVSVLLTHVFGGSFAASAPILDILWVVLACQILTTFSARALLASGRAGAVAPMQVVLAVCAPILQVCAVVADGARGAALATLAFEAGLLVAHGWQWRGTLTAVLRRTGTHTLGTACGDIRP